MADDGEATTMTREERLAGYTELREGLEEMLAMPEDERDGEMQALIADAMTELRVFAESLNAEETVEVTPGLVKVVVAAAATTAPASSSTTAATAAAAAEDDANKNSSSDGGDATVMIRFPPREQPRLCAPYEVLYDETAWYACVVTGVVAPAQPIDRVRYRVYILGYRVEEVVYSEQLRPWQPSPTLTEQLGSGVRCHAVHPRTGRFAAATVERLTLDGTVMVSFAATDTLAGASNTATTSTATAADDATTTTTTTTAGGGGDDSNSDGADAAKALVELPLSHIRVGKVYAQLRKRPQLTEAERLARRRANAQRKRERAEAARQQRADKIAQDSSDWRTLVDDLMGGGGGVSRQPPRTTKRPRFA